MNVPATEGPAMGVDVGTLPPGTRLGEFELTGVLGVGGFGIVYLAHDHSLGRRVALKEYMPSALAARGGAAQVAVKSERLRETFEAGLKSFVNEARLLAQFDHPALVKVYRFWEANGTAYMVMPFYEGVTLREHLRTLGRPPDEAWLRGLLAPLTEALLVIHAAQCFHRDIAPDNILLLAGSGQPLLLDFGAARRVIGDMTQALTVILKPGYAPLEQYAEVPGMQQGPWTDVYALAAVVYFALTGRTPPVSAGRALHDSCEPLAQLAAGRCSAQLLAAVDHALAVRPDQRTPGMAAFRAELGLDAGVNSAADAATYPGATGATAAPQAAPAAAQAGARRRLRPLHLGAGAGGLLLVAGAAFLAVPRAPLPAGPLPATALAPSAPTALPVPAAMPAMFSAQAEFARALQAQTAGFEVGAEAPRRPLRIGRDRLQFTLRSVRDGWVTVFMVGPDEELIRLIPNASLPEQRIRAGQALTLPPPHLPFEAADPPGREDFLVLISSRPREHQALGGREQDGLLSWRADAGLAALAARVAGRQGSVLTGLPPAGCASPDCWDYGAARFSVDVVR